LIARATDDSPRQFAALVGQHVQPGEVIDSAEWEIKFLADRSFSHPSVAAIDDTVAVVYLNKAPASVQYEPPNEARFIIDGPFSKLGGLYRAALSRGEFSLVASYGEYDLYRRR
jgi:hypothetical protein